MSTPFIAEVKLNNFSTTQCSSNRLTRVFSSSNSLGIIIALPRDLGLIGPGAGVTSALGANVPRFDVMCTGNVVGGNQMTRCPGASPSATAPEYVRFQVLTLSAARQRGRGAEG